MKIKRIIILLTILFAVLFMFRNAILGRVSKGWEKDYFITETTDFTIDLKTNLEKGCPKSGVFFSGDTVEVCNFKLVDLIHFISTTTLNSTEIIGNKYDTKSRYNFTYLPKESAGYFKNHKKEILTILGEEFNFIFTYDSLQSTVYKPTIIDYKKLKKQVSPNESNRYRCGDNYIEFMGNSLDGIFRAFDFQIKGLVVESDIKDSLFYSFTIPSTKKDKIISYLQDNIGIKLNDEAKSREILTIIFE